MGVSRREFVGLATIGGAAAAVAASFRPPAFAEQTPTVGLIFPPANYPIPPDAKRLFPTGLRFIGNGLGFKGMTIAGYDEAIPRVLPCAADLAEQGADLISVFGSSITFYKGRAFNEELARRVKAFTGKPATTQSDGLVDALMHVDARRVAVATAYTDVVTERLKVFLEEYGFEVVSTKGLGYERIPKEGVSQKTLHELGVAAYAKSSQADALVVSCGGLKTLDLIVPLEASIGAPVVSSTPHGLWHCARMLGVDARIPGFGRVMAA